VLVDTHAHLYAHEFDKDREAVIDRAISAGVAAILNIGCDLESSRQAVQSTGRQGIYATVGVHPHDARHFSEWKASIESLAAVAGVVAIGEIGLDYYRNLSEPKVQRDCFAHFIGLSRSLGLPIVIHDRDAHDDVLDMLRLEKGYENGGVLHCFSGDWDMAKKCVDMGFHIGIDGPVTYKNGTRLQEVAERLPLDRLLLETDCPYLTPEPHRGKRNEPAFVRLVAERVAAIRNLPVAELITATGDNAIRLFGLRKGKTLLPANS
jgi:TatD DNase family protein